MGIDAEQSSPEQNRGNQSAGNASSFTEESEPFSNSEKGSGKKKGKDALEPVTALPMMKMSKNDSYLLPQQRSKTNTTESFAQMAQYQKE